MWAVAEFGDGMTAVSTPHLYRFGAKLLNKVEGGIGNVFVLIKESKEGQV